MMFQNSILMGGRVDLHDRYREWRLDVDNMSYEVCFSSHELHHQFMGYPPPSLYYAHCFYMEKQELLELGERIGYVSTGLKEEEIGRCLRKIKLSLVNDLPPHLSKQVDRKCSICQVSLYQLVACFHSDIAMIASALSLICASRRNMKTMMRWESWIAVTAITYNVYSSGLPRKSLALSVRLKC